MNQSASTKVIPLQIPAELIANGSLKVGDIITIPSDENGHPILGPGGSLQHFRCVVTPE